MATNTGFIVFSSKKDLSEIFTLRTSVAGPNTGYIKFSTGEDLSQIFEPYVSGTKALTTGFKLADGVTDLCDVFVPKKMFELSTLALVNGTTLFSGPTYGIASANNGIGYCSCIHTPSSLALLFKTTDKGASWSLITVPNGSIRGVATNSANNKLAITYGSSPYPQYSNNGGSSFTTFNSPGTAESCVMTRNHANNYAIINSNASTSYFFVQNDYVGIGPYSSLPSGTTNNMSGANSISDVPNLFVTTSVGLNVYRNQFNGGITDSSRGTNTTVSIQNTQDVGQPKYVGTCCNTNNSVNLIVNRTSTTGGRIYRTTTWNGTFTAVPNSPIALWKQIATSSAGNVVCAIADKFIYLSLNAGIDWSNVSYSTALLTNEIFSFVTVSPDEQFIAVATIASNSPNNSRIFYYTL